MTEQAYHPDTAPPALKGKPAGSSMIPKSGNRFSEKIKLKQENRSG
jgi:hypothetical protein